MLIRVDLLGQFDTGFDALALPQNDHLHNVSRIFRSKLVTKLSLPLDRCAFNLDDLVSPP